MFVGFAVAVDPGVELALADGKPTHEAIDRDACFIAPGSGKINNGVTGIMGNPAAG